MLQTFWLLHPHRYVPLLVLIILFDPDSLECTSGVRAATEKEVSELVDRNPSKISHEQQEPQEFRRQPQHSHHHQAHKQEQQQSYTQYLSLSTRKFTVPSMKHLATLTSQHAATAKTLPAKSNSQRDPSSSGPMFRLESLSTQQPLTLSSNISGQRSGPLSQSLEFVLQRKRILRRNIITPKISSALSQPPSFHSSNTQLPTTKTTRTRAHPLLPLTIAIATKSADHVRNMQTHQSSTLRKKLLNFEEFVETGQCCVVVKLRSARSATSLAPISTTPTSVRTWSPFRVQQTTTGTTTIQQSTLAAAAAEIAMNISQTHSSNSSSSSSSGGSGGGSGGGNSSSSSSGSQVVITVNNATQTGGAATTTTTTTTTTHPDTGMLNSFTSGPSTGGDNPALIANGTRTLSTLGPLSSDHTRVASNYSTDTGSGTHATDTYLSTPEIIGISFGAAIIILGISIPLICWVHRKYMNRAAKHYKEYWDDNVNLSYINGHLDAPRVSRQGVCESL
ncbi:uncharacterized protein DDB_G0271670 [Octopus bimaculoides]|uniref:Uncharacterized protein n=1 Tax=Octopus bimaculoides TaxID=37653 RepID=A0A0L8FHN0_OCTBM|nr:uncharacterized protein DDB_G0271670 [Octopus bimaculoides]XP_052831902.1 uncharacterized protein DDB_G0271670 [Octopus bimaculoides]XP_052831903.1 uncharacterized protein DDB_G0271670 [Octopus bimaculoides]